jgi:predicted transcriptional regulator
MRPAGTAKEGGMAAGTGTPGTIGDQELALLRYVAEAGPATVGEVAESFGAPRGLARSTVLTVMERLRRKGRLKRRKVGGVYRYASPVPASEVLRGVVQSFVETTLGGSMSPFVTFLSEVEEVSDAELAELEQIVARLGEKRREP